MSKRSERANFEKYFGERLEDLKRKTQEQVKQSYDEWSSEYDKVKSRNNLIIIHLCDYEPQKHLKCLCGLQGFPGFSKFMKRT